MKKIIKQIFGVYIFLAAIGLILFSSYWLVTKQIHWAPAILLFIGIGFFYLSKLILVKYKVNMQGLVEFQFVCMYNKQIYIDSIVEYNINQADEDETIFVKNKNEEITFFSKSNTQGYSKIKEYLTTHVRRNTHLKLTMWNTFNKIYISMLLIIVLWVLIDKA